jgi:hypothetical protein
VLPSVDTYLHRKLQSVIEPLQEEEGVTRTCASIGGPSFLLEVLMSQPSGSEQGFLPEGAYKHILDDPSRSQCRLDIQSF